MSLRSSLLAISAAIALAACTRGAEPPLLGEAPPTPSAIGASSDLTQWDALSTLDQEEAVAALMSSGGARSSAPGTMYLAVVLVCTNARRLELDDRSDIATMLGYCDAGLRNADSPRNGVPPLQFANGREWGLAAKADQRAILRDYFFMTIAMSARAGGKASEMTIETVAACVTEAGRRADGRLRAVVDLVSQCETPTK